MLNPRLDRLRDYPFQRLRDLLDKDAPRAGWPVINLTIGEPQHPYPALVGETIAANAHLYGKYPPVLGTPELRQAIAAWLARRYRLRPDEIVGDRNVIPLGGTREGLFMIALTAVPERKNGQVPAVVMPNPFYQVYAGAAVAAGAEPVFLPATAKQRFLPDLDTLTPDLLARTALLFVCSPANPQGTVADLDYLKRVIALARQYDFVAVFDECYAEIYDSVPPPGGLEAAAELGGFDNVAVFHSLSKRSSVPGLRSGFCAGDAKLIAAFGKLRTYGAAGLSYPACAASVALWNEETHVEANRAAYRRKFDIAQNIIGNRLGFYRPAGGFYLWLDVGDGEQAAQRLWREAAVRVLPGRYLTRENDNASTEAGAPYIRVALVETKDLTRTAMERLRDTLC
jgi:succinyldiaminopimelate transaminase